MYLCVYVFQILIHIYLIITTCFVHLKYTSTPRLSSGPGDRHSWKMSSFRAAVFSIIVFRRDGWKAGGRSQGHLSPERQISGCQRAGSAFRRRAVKKGKKKPVLCCLTNWLKATQTDALKTWHTRLAYGVKFFDENAAADGAVKKSRQR